MTGHGPCPAARRATDPHLLGGCRCLVDAAPTHQVIHGLCAVGWPLPTLGRRLGCRHGRNVHRLLDQPAVTRATALRAAQLWDRYWDIPGPSVRAITYAHRRGWQAPDPVVVARLVTGIPVRHTEVDRAQAVRVLAARGATVNAIAVRFGMKTRAVARITATSTPLVAYAA